MAQDLVEQQRNTDQAPLRDVQGMSAAASPSEQVFAANPMHTGVTKDTASTPGYFRLLLPGLAGRYILRWSTTEWKDAKIDFKHFRSWLNRDKAQNEAVKVALTGAGDAERITSAARTLAEKVSHGTELETVMTHPEALAAERLMWHNGLPTERLRDAVESLAQSQKNPEWRSFTRDVGTKVSANTTGLHYDRLLGGASLALSTYYDKRVYDDIKQVFAETVAYEFNKKPEEVGLRDLMQSQNALVDKTKHSFLKKSMGRFVTDLVFFAGNLSHLPRLGFLKKYDFTDLGVGIKGASLIAEVLNKKTTILEDLVHLIDTKLNPLRGLGAPITTADIFDLYQKYAQIQDPNAAFQDALSSQNHDGRDWEKAQVIFHRITDLMNQTYKYKHEAGIHNGHDHAPADLALPKFLYLLGNGLINTYKPEETLAYVEVANRYGMEAVKQVQHALSRGVTVEQALAQYPVEFQESIHHLRTPQATVPAQPSTEQTTTLPGVIIHTLGQQERLAAPTQQLAI